MQLVPATAEEAVERDGLAYSAWGTPLELAAWLERERRLRAHPWSRAALTTFLLKDDHGAVLASCEAYRMHSWIDSAPGTSFGIASVFTEPRLRNRGYATAMMAMLETELRRLVPEAHAVVLFSDVGPKLYRQAGYLERPAYDLVFPPQPGDPAAVVDRLILATQLSVEHAAIPLPDEHFTVFPSPEQCDWHLERERAYAHLLGRPVLPAAGARIGAAVAFWTASYRDDQLKVLLMSAVHGEEARALILAAQRIAHRGGLKAVRLWENPNPRNYERPLAYTGAQRVVREGGLPMLRPLTTSCDATRWNWIPRAIWV